MQAAQTAQDEVRAMSEWIKFCDEQPGATEWVLAHDRDGELYIRPGEEFMYIAGGEEACMLDDNDAPVWLTHWLPLPPLPDDDYSIGKVYWGA